MIGTNKLWKLMGYDLNKVQSLLGKIRSLNSKDFESWQDRKIWEIFNYHKNNNIFYEQQCSGAFSNWEDIPIMTKTNFQSGLDQTLSTGFNRENTYVSNTSGSSGQPFWFAKDKPCHALAWAYIMDRYRYLGANINSLEARFYGSVKNNIQTVAIEKMKDFFFGRVRFDVFDQSRNYYNHVVDVFSKKPITFVYGYTNSILSFSKYVLESNGKSLKKVCPHLNFVLVTAEMCPEEIRQEITSAFGVPVYREYGTSETSIIAIENKQFEWELANERIFIEIVDKDNKQLSNGQTGRILVTDLFNCAMPIIRYEIGDYGALKSMDSFPYLKLSDLQGRISDTILLPSGRTAPGLTYYYVSRSIMDKANIIANFIVIQKSKNEFGFHYVGSSELSETLKQEIITASDKYLEPGLKYSFHRMETINQQVSGKFQHFFSEL